MTVSMAQVSLVPILLWAAAFAGTGIAIWRGPRPVKRGFVIDRLLRYLFFFPLGLQGLWAFVGHVFFPAQSAAAIGWSDSPFQFEVGMANLGLGLASLYAAFRGFEARLTASLVAASFLIGAGLFHIGDLVGSGNFAPGNAGPIMVTDFVTPIAVLLLLFLASGSSSRARRPKSPTTVALEAEFETARKAMREYRDALSKLGKQ
jgi:hypothetical protein